MNHLALLVGAIAVVSLQALAQSSSKRDLSIMKPDETAEDRALSNAEQELVANLSSAQVAEIDKALIANCSARWRKVAMVVGATMLNLKGRVAGIPDTYYAQRVEKIVGEGKLEAQGNLQRMRFSEVRLPSR